MMHYKRIDYLALHVSDLRKSVAFYETHFGFKNYFEHQTPTGLDIAYLRLGDTVLELTGRADPPLNGFHFCLETDDFEGAVASLKDAGVEMATKPHKTAACEPREANWMRVVFKGPDGESVEIRG